MDSREVKSKIDSLLNPYVVAELMKSLGYSEANHKTNFSIRDERTKSCSISKNCYIKDFGGDFAGDIIDFVQYALKVNFIEALKYIATQLNIDVGGYEYKNPIKKIEFKSIPKEETVKKTVSLEFIKSKRVFDGFKIQQGIMELFPFIHSSDFSIYNENSAYLAYSYYDNSLTVEYDSVSSVRRGRDGTKWKTFGSKSYIPYEDRGSEYVFISSGMAEPLLFRTMNLSFIGLQTDNIQLSNLDNIKKEFIGRKFVILEENDESSRKLSNKLIEYFGSAYVLPLAKILGKENVKGFDFRDFVNEIGNIENSFSILDYHLGNLEPLKKKGQEIHNINYDTTYIPDISHLERGVVKALTGSGKTHGFINKPKTLILVPRVKQATLVVGDNGDVLINKIVDSGAIITFDKFIGHYKGNNVFRDMIDNKKVKLIVDEAHEITAIPSKHKKIIYELDAIFLSGTIDDFFRRDLPHYNFIPTKKKKLYYTHGLIPDIKGSLIFADNAKKIKANYSDKGIVGANHKDFNSVDIHTTKEDYVFSTSALREGVSVNNSNFNACIVVYNECRLWSTKDVIQGLNRIRGEDKIRVFTHEPKEPKNKVSDYEYWEKVAKGEVNEKYINAIIGEYYSLFVRYTQKTSDYENYSEYGLVCFLAHLNRNDYNKDLYEWEEYNPEKLLNLEDLGSQDKEEGVVERETYVLKDGRVFEFDSNRRDDFIRWSVLYNAGSIKKMTKLTEFKSLKTVFQKSSLAKAIKSNYNKANKKFGKKYTMNMFLDLLRSCVVVEMVNSDNKIVQRIGAKTDINDLSIRVTGECPISGVKEIFDAVELPSI